MQPKGTSLATVAVALENREVFGEGAKKLGRLPCYKKWLWGEEHSVEAAGAGVAGDGSVSEREGGGAPGSPIRGRKINANFLYKVFRQSFGSRTSAPKIGPVVGRNFLTPGHSGVRVRNVRGKSGPKSLCLCYSFSPDQWGDPVQCKAFLQNLPFKIWGPIRVRHPQRCPDFGVGPGCHRTRRPLLCGKLVHATICWSVCFCARGHHNGDPPRVEVGLRKKKQPQPAGYP